MLTTIEVAELWDCTRAWVQVLCKSGRLKNQRVGRDYLISESVAKSYKRPPLGRPPQKKRTKPETNGHLKVGVRKAKKGKKVGR